MSPRRARRRDETPAPLRTGAWAREESHPDGEWRVRSLSAEAAVKTYRCPGCQQEVRPGTPHVVAWRPGDESGRRHWHTPCWHARLRRR
ncbi:MAG TPA: hypothetical protein VHE57_00110 [Mycobacteriales bacterium]|nr:hypothetical protein [Mycobacteriales bacterium]